MPSRICRSFGDSDKALQSGICLVAYFVVKCVHKILDWIQEKEIQRFGYELSDYEFGKTKVVIWAVFAVIVMVLFLIENLFKIV